MVKLLKPSRATKKEKIHMLTKNIIISFTSFSPQMKKELFTASASSH